MDQQIDVVFENLDFIIQLIKYFQYNPEIQDLSFQLLGEYLPRAFEIIKVNIK
ncbi:MAG: hypothetical protein ACFFAS_07970 [Promethearchaeota archaeon]